MVITTFLLTRQLQAPVSDAMWMVQEQSFSGGSSALNGLDPMGGMHDLNGGCSALKGAEPCLYKGT